MRLRVLGSLELRGARGEPLPLNGRRQEVLLAVLCAEANRIVPAGRLVELLWPDEGPRNPVAALQSQVWRLRRTLAAADLEVERRAPGYLLRVARHDLDALAFEALVTGASVADADPAALADLLTAGLAEWRGEPYLGLHDVPALRRESGRLTDLKLSWLERVAERMIEAGAGATVLTHLREAVAEAPLRERSRVLMMDALAAEGRTAEAVAQFHAYRRFQAEETGLDPGSAVQAAYRRLITSDEAGGATAPVVRSGSRPLAHTPVPDPLSPIVGREGETDQVVQLFSIGHRLITLTGPGGVGKTRLAVELAHRNWHGEAVFVDLSRVAEPDEVPGAFARAHGVSLAADDPVGDLSAAVGNRELLLVVDNFEQVLPAAGFLSGLLSPCPRVRAVVTSREPLGVPGEVEYPVPPLAVPAPGAPPGEVLTSAAVALFLQRVLDPSIVTGGDRAAAAQVGQLCRKLGGLPLAIELAAALARHRSIDEVFGDLMRSLAAPDNGESATGPLEAAIQWSYQRLRPAQQRILRQLCVFRGRFELAAAEAVCGRTELATTLDRLVALGLLTSHRQRTGMRYSVPGIFSEYLRRREAEPAECAAAEAAHLRYHASLCRDPRYLDDVLLTRIHAGYPDYLAALKRGMADVPPGDDVRLANEDEVYDLAIAMTLYWLWSDLPQVALPWLDRIADRYAGPPSRLARAHVLRAMFLRNQGRSEEATMLADRAVAALDAAEDWEWLLTCRAVLAASADDRADVDVEEVVRHASAMVQVARAGVPRRLAEALGYLSYAYVAADDGARAAEVAREALSLLDGIDSRSLRASTRVTAAQALIEAGHAVVAREVLASGLRELRDAPDGIPGYHLHLGWACLATGDHADALRWFRLALQNPEHAARVSTSRAEKIRNVGTEITNAARAFSRPDTDGSTNQLFRGLMDNYRSAINSFSDELAKIRSVDVQEGKRYDLFGSPEQARQAAWPIPSAPSSGQCQTPDGPTPVKSWPSSVRNDDLASVYLLAPYLAQNGAEPTITWTCSAKVTFAYKPDGFGKLYTATVTFDNYLNWPGETPRLIQSRTFSYGPVEGMVGGIPFLNSYWDTIMRQTSWATTNAATLSNTKSRVQAMLSGKQKLYYDMVAARLTGTGALATANAKVTEAIKLLQAYSELGWQVALQQDDLLNGLLNGGRHLPADLAGAAHFTEAFRVAANNDSACNPTSVGGPCTGTPKHPFDDQPQYSYACPLDGDRLPGDPLGNCLVTVAQRRTDALAARYALHSNELATGRYVESLPEVDALVTTVKVADIAARGN